MLKKSSCKIMRMKNQVNINMAAVNKKLLLIIDKFAKSSILVIPAQAGIQN